MSLIKYVTFLLIAVSAVFSAVGQVPPPPMLPGQSDVAEKLVHVFAVKDEAGYADLLADNVQVYEDGKMLARNKAEWLKRFGPMLSATGVSFKLAPGFASTSRVLFIEYFNSLASWGRTPPPDCCWAYDAVAYDIADGKIQVIRRLKGGASRLDEDGKTAGN